MNFFIEQELVKEIMREKNAEAEDIMKARQARRRK